MLILKLASGFALIDFITGQDVIESGNSLDDGSLHRFFSHKLFQCTGIEIYRFLHDHCVIEYNGH